MRRRAGREPEDLRSGGKRISRKKTVFLLLPCIFLAVGIYQTRKPLPDGVGFRGPTRLVPVDDVVFLKDLTFRGEKGEAVHEHEIFDALFAGIDKAEEFILLDMFLFNSYMRGSARPLRSLAGDLTALLVEKKRSHPSIRIDLITDPINVVYGGARSEQVETLKEAGVNVVLTDLVPLRDSNPGYSSLWRTTIRWFGNSPGGPLPHPFSDREPGVSIRSYLAMLNFKANHRKVFVADDGGTMTSLITSANPHDGSSAHSNVALQIEGDIGVDLVKAERAVARFSGARLVFEAESFRRQASTDEGEKAEVLLCTEHRIKEEMLRMVRHCSEGDTLWLAMFYLSDRDVVDALVGADRRGGRIRVILDPNRDAFGFKKKGIPNRQVARELRRRSDDRIEVRWYRTEGEQFHSKMMFMEEGTGRATVVLGSANLTRRNLGAYNLELDVRVTAPGSRPPMSDIRAYLERIWHNREGIYTVDYEEFADDSLLRILIYRLQEFTGLCSY